MFFVLYSVDRVLVTVCHLSLFLIFYITLFCRGHHHVSCWCCHWCMYELL